MRLAAIFAVLLVIVAGTTVTAIKARQKVIRDINTGHPVDVIDQYMMRLPGFLHDHTPYTDDVFPLPPFAMLLITPLTWLSRPDARMMWIFCKPFLYVPIFLIMLSMVRRAGGKIEPWALALIVIAWLNPLIGDIQEGQMNLLMLLPLSLALWKAQEGTRGGDIASGLLLAMAICIKVTPLAFLPYFLLRRRWGIAFWTVVGMALWLIFVPALFFGWNQNIAWLGQWLHVMVLPYVVHSEIKYANGESIPEFITRFLSYAPAWKSKGLDGGEVSHYMNILNLAPDLVRKIGRGVLLLIGLGGLWWARQQISNFHCRRYLMEIACVAAFMLWASERTWVHHYVTLILPLMVVGMIASDRTASESSRKRARIALIIAAVLIPWTSDLGKIFGPDGRRYVESLDFVLFASLSLVIAIVLAKYRNRGDRLCSVNRPAPPWTVVAEALGRGPSIPGIRANSA